MAQATGSRSGRLLQSAGSRVDHPVCNRNWFGSLALATGGRSNKRQLTAASDLCADFRIAYLVSHLDAVASAYQGRFAECILFCSDGAGLNDDHPDRAPRWNPQRGGNAVTSTERSSNEFQSEVRKSELDYCLFERSVKCVSSSVSFSTSAQAATQSPELTADAVQGRHLFLTNCAHCHGDDAHGDEGPDLHNLHRSDPRIREVLTAGTKGELPSFGKSWASQTYGN